MWLRFLGNRAVRAIEEFTVQRSIAEAVKRVGREGNIPVLFYLKEFEKVFSENVGAPLLGSSSGTDSLILALKGLNIGLGDEVIVPAFGCISTVSSVSWVGATPVFADITEDDFSINPEQLEKQIGTATKAIIVAHLFGQGSPHLSTIVSIAKKCGISVIEDAAQSFGARIKTANGFERIGTVGDIGCFSFSFTKMLSAPGNAGAITVKDPGVRKIIGRMRLYGAETLYKDHPGTGTSAMLQEIHAAALLAKLQFLGYWIDHRAKLAKKYTQTLSATNDIILPREENGTKRIWYRYVIRSPRRDALFKHLMKKFGLYPHLRPGIQYPVPLPRLSIFKTTKNSSCPVAERLSSTVISLPFNNVITENEVEVISESILRFFKR